MGSRSGNHSSPIADWVEEDRQQVLVGLVVMAAMAAVAAAVVLE